MQPVLYIGVARTDDCCRIAEYSVVDRKESDYDLYNAKLMRVLKSGRIQQHDRLTITDKDVGNIHYQADPTFLYMLICKPEYPQRLAFKLLGQSRDLFDQQFSHDMKRARTSSLSRRAEPILAKLIDSYQEVAKVDKVRGVAMQVDDVKGAMQSNIKAAMNNQDNLENLLDTSEEMRNQAHTFNQSSVRVKEKMRWKNIKMTIIAVVLIVVLLLAIVLPWIISGNKEEEGSSST